MNKRLRRDALAILRAALRAADPTAAVEAALRARRDLARYERIIVVGAGKATGTMARTAERVLGKRIAAGSVNVKDGDTVKLRRIEVHPASHPVPDRRGVAGAQRMAELCEAAGERDLVLCLLSGGASALTPSPCEGVTLEQKQETTRLLLECGANIHEMNAVRKHLSRLKGGRLAQLAAPAHVLSLILSDVVGDNLDVIGSGPTAPDSSTFETALAVLDKYDLRSRVPTLVRRTLEDARNETPKPGDPIFDRVENIIIGSNQRSLETAAREAKARGFRTMILSSSIEGETRDVARMHAAIARQLRNHAQPLKRPACIISGGETTVTLRGSGKGGRNQEFALACAIDIAGLADVLVLSAGTDGSDGPTDAAGAIATGDTVQRSTRSAREALRNNDAHPFFEELDDLIITGPTGTNVMDIHLILAA